MAPHPLVMENLGAFSSNVFDVNESPNYDRVDDNCLVQIIKRSHSPKLGDSSRKSARMEHLLSSCKNGM